VTAIGRERACGTRQQRCCAQHGNIARRNARIGAQRAQQRNMRAWRCAAANAHDASVRSTPYHACATYQHYSCR